MNVFASRCYSIGRRLCLSTEEDFEEALRDAAAKDRERQEKGGRGLPPLHGIPVSVKDSVMIDLIEVLDLTKREDVNLRV